MKGWTNKLPWIWMTVKIFEWFSPLVQNDSSVLCHKRWAYHCINWGGALLVTLREVIFSQTCTVDEVDPTGEVILYAAGWRTWSQISSDPVCGSNKVGIRCTFKLPWMMPSREVFIRCSLGRRKMPGLPLTKVFSHRKHYVQPQTQLRSV